MGFLNQPLIQFLILGGLVFGIYALVAERDDDPRKIVIDDKKYAELAGIFRDNQGREPTPGELADLTIKWAQNEVLFREAKLMGLDAGDEMIRDRLILKLRNIYFNRVDTPVVDDEVLAHWFELNRERYDQPATYDVEQFIVTEDLSAEREVRQRAVQINKSGEHGFDRLRRYARRSAENLSGMFEASHVEQMLSADQWTPLKSLQGWHLARVTARHAPLPVRLEDVATRVREDYKYSSMQGQLVDELANVARQYDIRMELSQAPEGWPEQQSGASALTAVDLADTR